MFVVTIKAFTFVLSFYFNYVKADPLCPLTLLPLVNNAPVVTTTLGRVQGGTACSRDLKPYFKYLGIPYAQPPNGPLRFEPPQPPRPWTVTRSATKFGSDCLQFDAILLGQILGDEDCLFLNIYTPSVNPDKRYPVLVWIHGGGFTAGSGRMYVPSYFMDTEEIIVVTLNYRLGALGFLNTGDDLVRGNMGLKDQNMAMRFVRDNIYQFGGDPNKITIFGESSGAASVHYHVISPLSRGLFSQAIMQSGNVFCPWAFTRNPRNQAFRFGNFVGCGSRTTADLVGCLRRKPGREIVANHSVLLSPISSQDDLFAGSVEAGLVRPDTFLDQNPFTMLSKGNFSQVPVIFGVNSAEGALKTARIEANPDILRSFNFRFNDYAPILLHYNKLFTNVSNKIFEHYFPSVPRGSRLGLDEFSKQGLRNTTQMISDGVWFHATELAARNHSQFATVYLNYFSYTSAFLPSAYTCLLSARISNIPEAYFWGSCVLNEFIREADIGNLFGACHTDDLVYYWAIGHNPRIVPIFADDYVFSKDFVGSISNFVMQEGELTFRGKKWERVEGSSSEPLKYMEINNKPGMIPHPSQGGIDFIKSLNIWDPYNPVNQ